MGEVTIRPAVETDTAGLALLRRIWTQETTGAVEDPSFEAEFAAWMDRTGRDRQTWVAEQEGRLIGMMNIAFFDRMPSPGKPNTRWAYLANAFVLKEFRNAGIGGKLLDQLLAFARETGLARIVLHPSDRSIPFYQRAGFGPADMLLVQHF